MDGRRPFGISVQRDCTCWNAPAGDHSRGYGHHSAAPLPTHSDRSGRDPGAVPDATCDRDAKVTGDSDAETNRCSSAPACGHTHPAGRANDAREHGDCDRRTGDADRDLNCDRDAKVTGDSDAETNRCSSAPACGHTHPAGHANGAREHGDADRDPNCDCGNGPVTYCDTNPVGDAYGHTHPSGRDHDI